MENFIRPVISGEHDVVHAESVQELMLSMADYTQRGVTVESADNCYVYEQGGPRTVGIANPYYPWYGMPPRATTKAAECSGKGCWYERSGYSRCFDHADGVCIVDQTVRL